MIGSELLVVFVFIFVFVGFFLQCWSEEVWVGLRCAYIYIGCVGLLSFVRYGIAWDGVGWDGMGWKGLEWVGWAFFQGQLYGVG